MAAGTDDGARWREESWSAIPDPAQASRRTRQTRRFESAECLARYEVHGLPAVVLAAQDDRPVSWSHGLVEL
jgi:hypothetical protein